MGASTLAIRLEPPRLQRDAEEHQDDEHVPTM